MPLFTMVSGAATSARDAQRRTWPDPLMRLRLNWVSTSLIVIILGGALARFLGGSWGLPMEFHADEWVIVDGAVDMARRHSFEPAFYNRPDHFETQLSFLAYQAYAQIFRGSSVVNVHAVDPAPFILISRTITACFGVAMIVVAYLIGKRFTVAIGVMAAFLVAFFPMYVNDSHFATPDVPLSLTSMVVILTCMRYLTSPTWGNLLLASLGVSVSIAIKYPGALGAIMIAITVVTAGVQARAWGRILVHGAAALGAVIFFLFAISPVLFTNFQVVMSAITGEAGNIALGADGLGWAQSMGFYAKTFATSAGVILVLCFLLGVMWSVRLRLTQSIPLWLGAIYWVVLSDVPLHWDRWGLPMFLTPLLIAPIGIYYSYRYLVERRAAGWLRWGAVGLGTVMVVNLLAGSVATTARFLAPETRTVAGLYFAAHGVDARNTIYEGYTPLTPNKARSIYGAFNVVRGRLEINRNRYPSPDFRYVALSSSMYSRYNADPKYARQQRQYARISKQFPLLATFSPAPREHSALEILNTWSALGFVGHVMDGGLAGPTLKLHEIPAASK